MSYPAKISQTDARIPPQAVEVEERILGTIMLETGAIDQVLEMITPEDMYKTINRQILEAMVELHIRNEPIDMITVEEELKRNKVDYSPVYLSDLTRSSSPSQNIKYYAQIIKEKSIVRQVILNANKLIKLGYDSETDAYDLVDEAQSLMFSLIEQNEGGMSHVSDVMQGVLEMVMRIQKEGEALGYESGLDIDTLINTWVPGKLYVVGARPSMGKTALVITLMKAFAEHGIDNGLLSLETTKNSIGVRLLSQEARISAERLVKKNELNDVEINALMDAGAKLSEQGITIDDTSGVNMPQIRSKCRIMKQKGCKIIFIDYLTLIKNEGRSKHEEVGELTKMLKTMSKEMDIPIVLLSQLSRQVESRNNKRPMLSDLRESGSIEEDADVIIFLYRDEYYGITHDSNNNTTEGILELIVAKNKDGKTGMKKHYFDKETMTVRNLSSYSNEPRRF